MALLRTQGIIIKVSNYSESDKIVTLYCPSAGKLTLIAKGANRSKRRFVNKLELFSSLEIDYNSRYALALLDQADLRDSYPRLRQNFRRYAAAELLCEHMLHWSHENDGDAALFIALKSSLNAINRQGPIRKTIILFLIFLYSRLGYQPDLSGCSHCGKLAPTAGPFQFQNNHGAIICRRCTSTPGKKNSLTLNTIKLIAHAQKLPFEKTARLQFPEHSIEQSMILFQNYGSYLLDRRLNSWDFL